MSDGRYRVRYTRTARRALTDELPLHIVDAVLAVLDGDLAVEPHRVGKPLHAPLDGIWSARRGTYRILYEIDDDARTVLVTGIEARADAYRPHRPHRHSR
ncbi:MAG TPA: type II toxin-antitoxin system RelE/ParE family toxin [Actinomycetales bacterium]|nr:type II toxin-antitoxin system RelE/ParE family toxin [Actinomycetales bacterium]